MAEFDIKTYIYTLKDPTTLQVRYVGKTVSPKKRFIAHKCLRAKKGTYLASWITSLRNKDLIPVMDIIDEADNDGWVEKEKLYIDFFKKNGCELVNLTSGGEGAFGYRHTEESKLKMSIYHKSINVRFIPTFKGKSHTKDSIDKMKESRVGNKNHNFGKPVSNSSKLKISKKLGKEININGTVYPSLRCAAKALNMLWSTFKYRYNKGYFK